MAAGVVSAHPELVEGCGRAAADAFPLILNLLKDALTSVAEGSEMPALATVLPAPTVLPALHRNSRPSYRHSRVSGNPEMPDW